MKIIKYLIILLLPVTIILSNLLYLTHRSNVYESIYRKENIYQHFQTTTEADNATKELIGYFKGQNHLEDNLFSFQAKVHLKDVKFLIHSATVINYFSIFVAVIMVLLFLKRKKYKLLKRSIIIGSSITIFVVIIIAISLSINFDFIFIIFHKILFSNNLWLFEQSDKLIKLFPPEFFITFANKLFINIILTAFAIMLAAMLFIKNDKFSN